MRTRSTAALAVVLLALVGCSSAAPGDSGPTQARETTVATPMPPATPTPEPVEEPTPVAGTYMLGQTATGFADGTLTVTAVEVTAEVATTDGAPITAAAGEQLVVIRTHFVNAGNATVDLSCSGVPNWYIQVFDTEQRELAQVFETYRIPGNPECNYQLLSGQEADWTLVFRSVVGATPRVFQITDSRTFDDWIAWALTDEPLRLAGS